MSSTTSGSPSSMAAVEDSTPQKAKILEALGYRVSALIRIVVRQAREVPILGKTIGYVEDTFSPWVEPVISHVEKDGLYILSIADNKIHTVSDFAMAHVPFAEKFVPQLQTIMSGQPIDTALMVLKWVRTRGVVGSTADMWVDYEPIVKSESQRIYGIVIRVPGVHVVISILSDISSPLVSVASDWVVKHTEFKDKHEISLEREASSSYLDSPSTPMKTPSGNEPDFNALADESDSDTERSCDPSSTEPVESEEFARNGKGEIVTFPATEGESASDDVKGKLPELTVVHEDDDEKAD
ncbi:unnamed protein product [Calypogeia fissa]